MEYDETTYRHPRTLQEAFGPYTSQDVGGEERPYSSYSPVLEVLVWIIIGMLIGGIFIFFPSPNENINRYLHGGDRAVQQPIPRPRQEGVVRLLWRDSSVGNCRARVRTEV